MKYLYFFSSSAAAGEREHWGGGSGGSLHPCPSCTATPGILHPSSHSCSSLSVLVGSWESWGREMIPQRPFFFLEAHLVWGIKSKLP